VARALDAVDLELDAERGDGVLFVEVVDAGDGDAFVADRAGPEEEVGRVRVARRPGPAAREERL